MILVDYASQCVHRKALRLAGPARNKDHAMF